MARRHSSPEDFRLLGMDSDPAPGDPDIILQIVRRYRSIGDDAERALGIVRQDGAISEGAGHAMDALRAKIGDDLPDKLDRTRTSYHDAAQAYSEYVPRLEEAQGLFDQAVDRARAAAPQADQAVRPVGADATEEERARARATQDAVDEGQAEMGAARSLAEQARTLRESAQRRLVQVLDQAADEAIPPRNVFQVIADFFKEFPFFQILLSIAVAVLAVFFPVAAALLGGALFVFNQVVASQTGGIKAGDFVTGLLGIVPGGQLLKVGGRLAEAISPALAASVRNLPLIKRATGSIGDIGRSLTESRLLGGFLGTSFGRSFGDAIVDIGKKFALNAGIEAAAKAANHDQLTAAGVLGGAAAGAVGGALAKGLASGAGRIRGVPEVAEGRPGRFGNTTEPVPGDSLGKRVSDQLGSFFEEGASVGAKIGVGVAQGGDPKEVAAGEIANGAAKLATGALGKASSGRGVDSVGALIPLKGHPRPAVTPTPPTTPPTPPPDPRPVTPPPADPRPVTPPPADPRPVTPRPADPRPVTPPLPDPRPVTPPPADPRPVTPPPADPRPVTPPAPDPRPVASPGGGGAASAVDPVDVPLPPSPTVVDGPSVGAPPGPPAGGHGG
ncbi:hypothetical protein [Streptomyces sp. NPDC093970]|uniref:hypothetical protein n=1 Tax=Streptomyces sp. NPDC093970 TaxID=3155076 RepID=UPI00344A0FD4